MTMQCTVIAPDATFVWNPETNSGDWSGPNTCTFKAVDDVTNEEKALVVPFQPECMDAAAAITTVVGMSPQPADSDASDAEKQAALDAMNAYGKHFNNMLWACAVALDRWPTCGIVTVDGVIQAKIDDVEVAVINNDDEQVHPLT